MEYLIEEHKIVSNSHLEEIRKELDSLRNKGEKIVDSMSDISSKKLGMFLFDSLDHFLSQCYMMDLVLDTMLTRIKELKVTNVFAAKYLCQRLLDASDTAVIQVNTLDQLNLVY